MNVSSKSKDRPTLFPIFLLTGRQITGGHFGTKVQSRQGREHTCHCRWNANDPKTAVRNNQISREGRRASILTSTRVKQTMNWTDRSFLYDVQSHDEGTSRPKAALMKSLTSLSKKLNALSVGGGCWGCDARDARALSAAARTLTEQRSSRRNIRRRSQLSNPKRPAPKLSCRHRRHRQTKH